MERAKNHHDDCYFCGMDIKGITKNRGLNVLHEPLTHTSSASHKTRTYQTVCKSFKQRRKKL